MCRRSSTCCGTVRSTTPQGVLYGRRDGFHLSDLGNQMAQRIAETIGDRDITHMRTSPLERAQETGAPLAAVRGLTPVVDPRVIESSNAFEGLSFGDGAMTIIKRPAPVAPPLQPAQAVVGRALRRDRRPDGRGDPRRPRRRARSRGRRGVPPAADLDDASVPGEAQLPPPPEEPPVHPVLADQRGLRRRPDGPGALLRARRRPDPGRRPLRPVLGRRRRRRRTGPEASSAPPSSRSSWPASS